MSPVPFPRIDGRRYQAAKAAVRERCRALNLCESAAQRCIDRAAAQVRAGRSAAVAIAEGNALARRLASLIKAGYDDPRPAA